MADWTSATREGLKPRFHLSWGAVAASAITMLSLQLLLMAAAFAIAVRSSGAPSFSVAGVTGPFPLILAALVATVVGGWVGGRASGALRRRDGALHGALGWATGTVAVAALGAWFAAGLTRTLVQSTTSLLAAAPRGEVTLDLSDVRREARALSEPSPLLRRDRSPATNPIAQQKADGETALDILLQQYLAPSSPGAPVPSRETLVNVLAVRGALARPEAERTIERWVRTVDERRQTLNEQRMQAEQRAREAQAITAQRVSDAATWTAVALFFALFGATLGGFVGAPGVEVPRIERREATVLIEEAA